MYWKSSRQKSVTRSAASAEHLASADTVTQVEAMKYLLQDMGVPQPFAIPRYMDNQACLKRAAAEVGSSKLKNFPIALDYIKEQKQTQCISITYVPTDDMLADVLTKPLGPSQFIKFRKALRVQPEALVSEELTQ